MCIRDRIKNEQIASQKELEEKDIEKILRKEVKKIQDSIEPVSYTHLFISVYYPLIMYPVIYNLSLIHI